ncbi:hypothetical protein ACFFIT_09775 [Thorsellia kenyensis]|uniref:Uncharacterized protein n=1 Tax=Thorsellia kenyensis TaxID=1549888 RepID=A0ABV6CBJ2_9GAMM
MPLKSSIITDSKAISLLIKRGKIVNFDVTSANIDEREMIIELLEGKTGLALGD